MTPPRVALLTIALIALFTGVVTRAASLRQSATFDEIVLVSGGARAVTNDRWDMITDQPPLMLWLYGWAVAAASDDLPPEDRVWGFDQRWDHARAFFFEMGNDPQLILGRARLVTTLMAVALVAAAGLFTLWIAGPIAGVLAAGFTALLPDVLAHGGIAYNDLPLALFFLLSVWAIDAALRDPGPVRGMAAGLAVAATFGTKMSALALGPVAVVLFGLEAWSRNDRDAWIRRLAVTVPLSFLVAWLALVVLYSGDPTLTLLRFNFWRTVLHASGGHEAPAFLLGQVSAGGWWYYFPLAFLFKTPVGHQLALVAAVVMSVRRGLAAAREVAGEAHSAGADGAAAFLRLAARSRRRAPVVGVLVFGAFLMRSNLNAGVRYALPVLPLLCVFIGAALQAGTRTAGESHRPAPHATRLRPSRAGALSAVVAMLISAVSVLPAHPWYLSWGSVWAGGRDGVSSVLSDSSVDWGQGLLELRRFMDDEEVRSVRLSYFGSARPAAYGIEYVALPSFFRLAVERTPGAEEAPRFTVISATNLQGLYLQGYDPFATYRDRVPYRVLAGSLFVFDEATRPAGGPSP